MEPLSKDQIFVRLSLEAIARESVYVSDKSRDYFSEASSIIGRNDVLATYFYEKVNYYKAVRKVVYNYD